VDAQDRIVRRGACVGDFARHRGNTSSAAKSTTLAKVPLVDINSASRDELVRVPGIGEAIADHIIAGRPWKQKSDLLAKGVANKAQYAKMRSHIIAKQK